MKGLSRKPKSPKQRLKDFYQTHPGMPKILVEFLKENNFPNNLRVLDPCSGRQVITRELIEYFHDVTHYDKYMGRKKRDFLKSWKKYDLIAMNAPFSQKDCFIKHARKKAKHVFALFPLNVSQYNYFHQELETDPEFVGLIKMTPKMILHDGTETQKGGNSVYCWYYWQKGYKRSPDLLGAKSLWLRDLREYL